MEAIVEALSEIVEEKNYRFCINHISSMFQIFFSSERVYDYRSAKTADAALFAGYHRKLLERGVFFPPSQFETCFVSESHSEQDIVATVKAMSFALSD